MATAGPTELSDRAGFGPAATADSLDNTKSAERASASVLHSVLSALASLKLTVALFAAAIFIVLAGTLAQVDNGIWQTIDQYFRNWNFVRMPLQMFTRYIFPSWETSLHVYFFSGWQIGAALFVNLLAAHLVRFRVAASGKRLWGGVAVIALGLALLAAVIAAGVHHRPETEIDDAFADVVWNGLRAGLLGSAALAGYLLHFIRPQRRGPAFYVLASLVGTLAVLSLALVIFPQMRLDKSGLRIVWQLLKAGGVAGVLLAGCMMVFRRRAGIVLLHGGVGLMMIGELLVGQFAHEAQSPIFQGFPSNYQEDTRLAELCVTDFSDPDHPVEIKIPQAMLREAEGEKAKPITHDALPFALHIDDWMENADLEFSRGDNTDDAIKGIHRQYRAEERPINPGASAGGQIDIPTAYVTVEDPQTQETLGKYLLSTIFTTDPIEQRQYIEHNGKFFEIALRYVREYTPYTLALDEFKVDNYVASDTPKNYSSRLHLNDPKQDVDRSVRVWMNNPLRYAGTTFYQSGFRPDPRPDYEHGTVLQVVSNESWLLPYLGCGIVSVGLLAHFLISLNSFLQRRSPSQAEKQQDIKPTSWVALAVPAGLVIICSLMIGRQAKTPQVKMGEPDIYAAAKLPIAYQGRVKPLDTLARNTLRVISGRDYYELITGDGEDDKQKRPAIEWLLDAVSGSPRADTHQVFRIENHQVQDMLGLKARKRFRYSLDEIIHRDPDKFHSFLATIERIKQKQAEGETLDLEERQAAGLYHKLGLYRNVQESFLPPDLQAGGNAVQQFISRMEALDKTGVRVVPPAEDADEWMLLPKATIMGMFQNDREEIEVEWYKLLLAYSEGEEGEFNENVDRLTSLLTDREQELNQALAETPEDEGHKAKYAEQLDLGRVHFETWINRFAPSTLAQVFYVLIALLCFLSWLGFRDGFQRAATWLVLLTFALHTFSLVARIYISGRPPVTNLYSSAVFIGWAIVLLGIILQAIYRQGFGNLLAAVTGFATLTISYHLAADGDTIQVMQAVLDTNFWLATHVVCITLGYATTFAAGFLGIFYLLGGMFAPGMTDDANKTLSRMTYGSLCFALLFSFVGTVLGGLWADDSWGRFWGWDPKENGALMIVLWNALVLHARWAGLVRQRGIATLAVFGNIVVAWSWFGVNELGVGLHAYGESEGHAFWLKNFAVSQLAIFLLGILPTGWWLSKMHAADPSDKIAPS